MKIKCIRSSTPIVQVGDIFEVNETMVAQGRLLYTIALGDLHIPTAVPLQGWLMTFEEVE